MATLNQVQVTTAVNNSPTTIVNADGTNLKDLFTAGTGGSLVRGISVMSNDTTARDVGLFWYNGSTAVQIGYVNVPASSGTTVAKTKPISLLDKVSCPGAKLDMAQNAVIQLAAGHKLQVGVDAAVTAAKTITVFAQGEDFGA